MRRLWGVQAMTKIAYDFRFDHRFVLVDRLLGITPNTAIVEFDDVSFTAQFGRWTVATPIANLASASVTGPYALAKVFGPPHISFADGGLTFATNTEHGVCIKFREPVTGLLPLGLVTHMSLTVTVRQAGALAEMINALGAETAVGFELHPLEQVLDALHDELNGLSASELRGRARADGLRITSSMTKAGLIAALVSSFRT